MKRRDTVKSNILFNNIVNNGTRYSNKYFVICSEKSNLDQNKFGIAVGKKVGNAVTRNKLKRQMRNIIDKNIKLFKNYYNYIIIVKKSTLDLKFNDMEKEFINLINKGE